MPPDDELETLIRSLTPAEQDELLARLEGGVARPRTAPLYTPDSIGMTPPTPLEVGNTAGWSAQPDAAFTSEWGRRVADPWVEWGKRVLARQEESQAFENQLPLDGPNGPRPGPGLGMREPPGNLSGEGFLDTLHTGTESLGGLVSGPFMPFEPLINPVMEPVVEGVHGTLKALDTAGAELFPRQQRGEGEFDFSPPATPFQEMEPEIQFGVQIALFKKAGHVLKAVPGLKARFDSLVAETPAGRAAVTAPIEPKPGASRILSPEEAAARAPKLKTVEELKQNQVPPSIQKPAEAGKQTDPKVLGEAELADLGESVWEGAEPTPAPPPPAYSPLQRLQEAGRKAGVTTEPAKPGLETPEAKLRGQLGDAARRMAQRAGREPPVWVDEYGNVKQEWPKTQWLDPNDPPPGVETHPTDWLHVDTNTRWVWRSMGEKEFAKLQAGEMSYGGKSSGRGNYLAEYPEKAAKITGKGKVLVEFSGAKPGAESSSSILGRENVTRVWRHDGTRWVEEPWGQRVTEQPVAPPAAPEIPTPARTPPEVPVAPEATTARPGAMRMAGPGPWDTPDGKVRVTKIGRTYVIKDLVSGEVIDKATERFDAADRAVRLAERLSAPGATGVPEVDLLRKMGEREPFYLEEDAGAAIAAEAKAKGISLREALLKEIENTDGMAEFLKDDPAYQALAGEAAALPELAAKEPARSSRPAKLAEETRPDLEAAATEKTLTKKELALERKRRLGELGYDAPDAPVSVNKLMSVKGRPWANTLRTWILENQVKANEARLIEKMQELSKPSSRGPDLAVRDTTGIGLGAAGELVAKGAKAAYEAGFKPAVKTLRDKFGRGGGMLADLLVDLKVDAQNMAAGWQQRYLDALATLPKTDRDFWRANYIRITERGHEVELSESLKSFLETRAKLMNEIEETGHRSGKRIDDGTERGRRSHLAGQGEKFASHQYRAEVIEALERGDSAYEAKLFELNPQLNGNNPFLAKAQIEAKPTQFRAEFRKPTDVFTEKARTLKVPDEWLNPDGVDADMTYFHEAAWSTAEQARLLYRHPTTGQPLQGGQGHVAHARKRIAGEMGRDAATEATELVEHILGRGKMESRGWQKFQELEGAAQATTKLGFSVPTALHQLSQLVGTATLGGSKAAWKGLVDATADWRAQRRTGLTEGGLPRRRDFGTSTAGMDLPGETFSQARRVTDAVTTTVYFPDAAMRTVASAAAPHALEFFSGKLRKGGKAAEHAHRVLREKIMMSEGEIAQIEQGTVSNRTLSKFRQRFVEESQGVADRFNLAEEVTKPGKVRQVMLRFKKFAIGQTRFYVEHVFDEAHKGNWGPMARALVWSQGIGEVIGETKETLFGPSGRRQDYEDASARQVVRRLLDNLDQVAFVGLVGQIAGRTGGLYAQEEKLSLAQLLDDPLTESLLPPSLRTAVNVAIQTPLEMVKDEETLENPNPAARAALDGIMREFAQIRHFVQSYRFTASESLLEEIEKAYRAGNTTKTEELIERYEKLHPAEEKADLGAK